MWLWESDWRKIPLKSVKFPHFFPSLSSMLCFHYGHTKSVAELDKQQQWTVCSREHSWKGGKAYLSSLLSLLPLICKWKCQTQNSAAITWKFIYQLI